MLVAINLQVILYTSGCAILTYHVSPAVQARAEVARLTEELNLAQKQISMLHAKADRVRVVV